MSYKTITEMKETIENLMQKVGDMKARCVSENRNPNPEERELVDTILSKVDELEEQIATEERIQNKEERLKEPVGKAHKVIPGEEKTEQQKRDSFLSPGEFFQAVMRAGTPGEPVDPRLSTRAASGLSEGVPSDGGFLVDSELASRIIKPVWTNGEILPRINKITLSGNKNGMKFNGIDETSRANGYRSGGITVYSAAEAAEKTGSKPKFRQISLSLKKLIGLCYATDELLEDAQVITNGFQDEFTFKLVDWIINGTGAGEALGILNSGCVVSVGKEAGQDADTIVYDNINKMFSRMIASSRPNSVWVINQDCEPQLNTMSIPVGTGGVPVYLPAGGASASPYATLLGRPVVPIEHCQTVGTTGDIMLCDFSKYLAIDKGGLKQDVSIHVRFLYDESVFRFVYRFDGQPELGSAITPYKGTNTLSHFVKLDSRD